MINCQKKMDYQQSLPLRNVLGISVSLHFPLVSEVNMPPELLGRKMQ